MKQNILDFLNDLEGYKTSCLSLHWGSNNMSEHNLFDEISSYIKATEDTISEIAQGVYGQMSKEELKPNEKKITNPSTFIDDVLSSTKTFYESLDDSFDNIGMKSSTENFIAEMQKCKYLVKLAVKENELKESKSRIKMNRKQFEKYLAECVTDVLKQIKK